VVKKEVSEAKLISFRITTFDTLREKLNWGLCMKKLKFSFQKIISILLNQIINTRQIPKMRF